MITLFLGIITACIGLMVMSACALAGALRGVEESEMQRYEHEAKLEDVSDGSR